MRNTLVILLLASIFQPTGAQSKWSYSFGLGPNTSKLYLEKPEVPYLETYHARIGFNIGNKVAYQLNPSFRLSLEPGISMMRSEDNFDLITAAGYLNIPLKIEYRLLNRVLVHAGLSYQYLLKLSLSNGEDRADFTGFANHRHFFNPVLGVSYALDRNFGIELSALIATRDLFNAGVEDLNGNIIGPLKSYNHALSFTVWCTPTKQKKTSVKSRMKLGQEPQK